MSDGCRRHAVTGQDVTDRWVDVAHLVDAATEGLTPDEAEAESLAQGSVLAFCHCCLGPTKDKVRVLCTRCTEGCSNAECVCQNTAGVGAD